MDEFRLLGPLEAVVEGQRVRLDAEKPRALLALLLLNRNRVVATDRLVEELWGEAAPARATKTLQVYISQLRKAIGAERLVTRPPGYELRVDEGELDLDRFERLAAEAREQLAAGKPKEAARLFREALALWRGPALREFRTEPFADAASSRLDELWLIAQEDQLEAELAAGRHAAALPELEALVASHPLRERPRELLMVALYRSGRQADALELYRRTRELYVEELGIEPGPALQELERAVLRQDPSLQAPARAAPPEALPPPRRRTWALVVAAALAAAAVVAAVIVLVASGGGDGGGTQTTGVSEAAQLRTFVVKVENFLGQSSEGRREAKQTIGAAFGCALAPRVAAARLERVQRNRQSLLQQVAALSVPNDDRALRAADLLQKAGAASIRADGIYQDWLAARKRCPRRALPPAGAAAADLRATRLKRAFLVAFDPLAQRFHKRVWRDTEF
ncbi:MAG TPA: AfsR/SARP family transcriptional regulator [Gaiellaceae bacterium]